MEEDDWLVLPLKEAFERKKQKKIWQIIGPHLHLHMKLKLSHLSVTHKMSISVVWLLMISTSQLVSKALNYFVIVDMNYIIT